MLKRHPLCFIQLCATKLFVQVGHVTQYMHLVETIIPSPHHVILRPTKNINNLLKGLKILIISFFSVKNRWKGFGLSNIESLFRRSINTLKDLSFVFLKIKYHHYFVKISIAPPPYDGLLRSRKKLK